MRNAQRHILGLFAIAALAACSKPAPVTAPTPVVNSDSVAKAHSADSAAAVAAAVAAKADAIAKAKQDSIEALAAGKSEANLGMKRTIYFAFDQSALTDTAMKLLDRKIVILNANPTVSIQIEGDTDERGSSEYNLALGQRRAAAVKRYLTQHGITDGRITIISAGMEKPADPGHNETAWALDRRAEFVITVGELKATP